MFGYNFFQTTICVHGSDNYRIYRCVPNYNVQGKVNVCVFLQQIATGECHACYT